MGCPVEHKIPQFLEHLPTYHGMPVPFTFMWIEGKPEFTILDPRKVTLCISNKLCAICGLALGEFAYFIGGPLCKQNRLFTDPPMHEECAEFSAKICPFLNGNVKSYTSREHSIPIKELHMETKRPEIMFIMQAKASTVAVTRLGSDHFITAHPWLSWRQM